MCGEQHVTLRITPLPIGSPPRVRGTADGRKKKHVQIRITPACAGNRLLESICPARRKDHPRVCGEQLFCVNSSIEATGSPPRVRGTVISEDINDNTFRITPACAGNSSLHPLRPQARRDHPRVCGEQFCKLFYGVCIVGSPPRVRGTALARKGGALSKGITPACAGNRGMRGYARVCEGDHPRVCGEQGVRLIFDSFNPGSPPRVRGTVMPEELRPVLNRITPACAGNSPYPPRLRGNARDHPRVCGEQRSTNAYGLCSTGSPPRVRGTVTTWEKTMTFIGITPACAGNRAP